MPNGLKNAGSTFAKMMKVVLGPQLNKNILSYIDDIVVTTKEKEYHVAYIYETFANLRKEDIKLNREKCVISVSKDKALGCVVNPDGIHANPDKTNAILLMEGLLTKNEV
jgi:hypothetical protein